LDECQRRFAEPAEGTASFYPLLRILHQVREQIEPLCQTEWVPLMLAMVRWYLDRGMIHQAYTTMRELYATHACELAGVDVFNDKVREQLLRWAYGKARQSKSSAPQAPPQDDVNLEGVAEDRLNAARAFLERFSGDISDVSNLRNQLNHGFFQCGVQNTPEQTFRTAIAAPMDRLLEFMQTREETSDEQGS